MKKYAVNALATTGLSLLLLSVIALMFHAKFLGISAVFETFAANVFIHIGLFFTHKIEFKYAAAEPILDIIFIIVVLMICGAVFGWFASTPIWALVAMAVVIYLLSIALNLFRMQQEANEINALLQKRNKTNKTDA